MQRSKSDGNNNHTRMRSHRWPTDLVFMEDVTESSDLPAIVDFLQYLVFDPQSRSIYEVDR